MSDEDKMVTVCAECLCASCWQGVFLCQKSRDANIVSLPIKALRAMGREHEEYWNKPETGNQ